MNMRLRGFTLIELLIALAIFGFLIMLAGPMYAQFMANSQIRNAGDGMLNGVLWAQTTAIRGNTPARLVVDPAAGTGGWRVLQTIEGAEPSPPNPIQVYSLTDGSPNASVTTTPAGATQITFDGFGRIIANADASATISCIDIDHTSMTGLRNLRVVISNTGIGIGTKLCDPAAASTEPQACPATPCA
ncbi:MAG TPA: GspH/FimT family pseudopilin [Casimicrobiaceae bacterium]|jgi:type IV fimbrial biogenesis protein FimT|nr:GspH/FimT family pseudopilin [Casimicrobiaceae bacterium]